MIIVFILHYLILLPKSSLTRIFQEYLAIFLFLVAFLPFYKYSFAYFIALSLQAYSFSLQRTNLKL